MKSTKDWKVLTFLKDKIPAAADEIDDTEQGFTRDKNPIKAMAGIVSDYSDKLTNKELNRAYELLSQDINRENFSSVGVPKPQKNSLGQGSLFARRFIYYYAAGVTLFAFSVVLLLIFVDVPENNQRILDMSFGVIVGTGLVGIFQFFFGSSKGSKDKDAHIQTIMKKFNSGK